MVVNLFNKLIMGVLGAILIVTLLSVALPMLTNTIGNSSLDTGYKNLFSLVGLVIVFGAIIGLFGYILGKKSGYF